MTILKNFSKKDLLISGKVKVGGELLEVYFDTLEDVGVIQLMGKSEISLLNGVINAFYGGSLIANKETAEISFRDIPVSVIYYQERPVAITSPQDDKWFDLADKKLYHEDEIYNTFLQKSMVEQLQNKKIPLWFLEHHAQAVTQLLEW